MHAGTGGHVHAGLVAVTGGRFGTGRLVAPQLVLTSRHVVDACTDVIVRPVVGTRGSVSFGVPVTGRVIWAGAGPVDAALVELGGEWAAPEGFYAQPRWGRLVGKRPVRVVTEGMPSAAQGRGGTSDVEAAHGEVHPLTYTRANLYAVDLTARPMSPEAWSGISGSALMAETGFLVGVISWNDEEYGNGRLLAVPAETLFASPGFQEALGERQYLEPVEIAHLMAPDVGFRPSSLGDLLRPDNGLVEFTGRRGVLADLCLWRDGPALVSLRLITGPGGTGKTRLAREFIVQSRAVGWIAGELRPSDQGGDRLSPIIGATGPVLLVIDDAAAAYHDVVALLRKAGEERRHVPLRVLVLARMAGTWWPEVKLAPEVRAVPSDERPLPPLARTRKKRLALFHASAQAFAPEVARLLELPAAELAERARGLRLPRLDDGHALAIQLSALLSLLGPGDSTSQPEDQLLKHERRLRDQLAEKRALGGGIAYTRDRALVAAVLVGARGRDEPTARDRACAVVAAAAREVVGDTGRQRQLASWIRELYPPELPGWYWGLVRPDRLGEFLMARVLAAEPDLPSALASADVVDDAGAVFALWVLSRVVQHDPGAVRYIHAMVAASRSRFVPAALEASIIAEDPGPLHTALAEVALADPEAFRRTVADMEARVAPLPRTDTLWLQSPATASVLPLSAKISLVYRLLAEADAQFTPDLANSLRRHATRLLQQRLYAEAQTEAAEAVRIFRELVAADAGQGPGLAVALLVQARVQERLRMWDERRLSATEAVSLFRAAEADSPQHLEAMAEALEYHADVVELEEAEAISAEAAALRRRLAATDPQKFGRGLAKLLISRRDRFMTFQRWQEALEEAGQVVALHRELDSSDDELAEALHAQSTVLGQLNRWEEAASVSTEAVAHWRSVGDVGGLMSPALGHLAIASARLGREECALAASEEALDRTGKRSTDRPELLRLRSDILFYFGRGPAALEASAAEIRLRRRNARKARGGADSDLARALGDHTRLLVAIHREEEALVSSTECLEINRRLSERIGSYRLADALRLHAEVLVDLERFGDALPFSQEAVDLCREQVNPHGPYELYAEDLHRLAVQLGEHSRLLEALARGDEAHTTLSQAVREARRAAELHPLQYAEEYAGALCQRAELRGRLELWGWSLKDSLDALVEFRAINEPGPGHTYKVARCLLAIGLALTRLGRSPEAAQFLDEAYELASAGGHVSILKAVQALRHSIE
ncbi:trypsin-like peptidase domain-containing protein [Streptomyces coeruleorubidus]|uniref:trypsin-like peptidase domain-containing protein n=1 Tax=Streptomyces coeruleorubidus TaxID=116188 RepID=UPI003684DA5B